MAAATSVDAINLVNSLINTKIINRVWWNKDSYPANSLVGWFNSAAAPVVGPIAFPHANLDDNINASNALELIRFYSGLHASIRRVRIIIYYNNNGTLSVTSDNTAIGSMATGIGYNLVGLNDIAANTPVTRDGFITFCNAHYNNWNANAATPTTETLTNTVCHTSCHSSCHSSRGRR